MNEPTNSFSRGRKWSIGFHAVVSVVAFVAIMVMVNFLSARHFIRFHWSERGGGKLTPRSIELVRNMTNQVEITVLYVSGANPDLYGRVALLLEEYQSASASIAVRKVDPVRNPAGAQAVRTRFKLPSGVEESLVVFVSHGDRVRVITERMLAGSDYVMEEGGPRSHYVSFDGERMITSAVADVIAQRRLRAYFVNNHGEHDRTSTDAQDGYALFADLLAENNIHIDALNLGTTGEIPSDCDLLIVASPKSRFLPTELERIEQYLNQGGRMLTLFSLTTVKFETGLERLLRQWGVDVGANVVEDEDNQLSDNEAAFFQVSRFGRHPIVGPLRDLTLPIMYPRTIAKVENSTGAAATANVTELIYSGTNSVKLTRFPEGVPQRTGNDPKGEFPLAVAVEKGGLPGVTTLQGGVTRIVVVGDSFLFDNQLLNLLGNRDFANQIVNWLLDRSELMAGIGPRPMAEYQLALTPRQLRGINLVLTVGLPLSALALGFLVWLRRRS